MPQPSSSVDLSERVSISPWYLSVQRWYARIGMYTGPLGIIIWIGLLVAFVWMSDYSLLVEPLFYLFAVACIAALGLSMYATGRSLKWKRAWVTPEGVQVGERFAKWDEVAKVTVLLVRRAPIRTQDGEELYTHFSTDGEIAFWGALRSHIGETQFSMERGVLVDRWRRPK